MTLIKLRVPVDGYQAGDVINVRGGYAQALIAKNAAVYMAQGPEPDDLPSEPEPAPEPAPAPEPEPEEPGEPDTAATAKLFDD